MKRILLTLAFLMTGVTARASYVQPPYHIEFGGTGLSTVATGSLLYGPASGQALTALPIGSTGNVLTVVGGVPAWSASSMGTVTSVTTTNTAAGIFAFAATPNPITSTGTIDLSVSGTSGGIPYFNSSSQLSSSAALTNHAIVLGGGAGAAPTVLGSLGTTTTVLHGNASGAPTFAAVSLSADVTGTLPFASVGFMPVRNGGDAAYSILAENDEVRAGTTLTAQRAYTLDACTTNIGEIHYVKNPPAQTFNIVLTGGGSDLIDGAATLAIEPGDSFMVICAASAVWDIL